ncbi:permease (plasmid) [Gemmatirosa kalamazoonensis]|uniref:Permease n=1 Tax=Gemmatirosa kalamazoonensis TaxID=861299 RepID=W0RQV0_9BACT|nr:ADOP family duplicated permease [Gemmatirosa kalamazoonensis]AHG93091.1 permease [Gemmatirosa kalamazoonensis]
MIRPRVRRLFRLALRRPALRERDVDDEIRLHVDLRAERLVREGWTPEAARAEAWRRFGALTEARPRLLDAARRRDTRMTWSDRLDSVRQDAAFAVRQLRSAPGVAAAAIVTLALGIGANATMFGVVDRLLLRPPALVADAGHVTRLYIERRRAGFNGRVMPMVSAPAYFTVRDSTRAFAAVAGFFPGQHVVGEGDAARQRHVIEATGNFFTLLGVRPALGRFFGPDDDRVPAGSLVAVLGDRYWREAYGADSAVLGRTVVVEGDRYVIVGVAPRGFNGTDLEPTDVYVPLSTIAYHARARDWSTDGRIAWVRMVARLRPGATTARAEREATAALRLTAPDTNAFDYGARVIAAPVTEAHAPVKSERRTRASIAAWLAGVAAIVLLVACANVANLLLARAVRRRREIAVRTALGAGRWRLARQLLTESALVAALGGVGGLLVARWGGAAVRATLLPDVDWSQGVVSGRVLLFALGATTLTALLTALAPAAHVAALGVTAGLRTGARDGGGRRSRTRSTLLLAQAALSVVLLVGAGLFVRSLRRIGALDFGYEPARLVFAEASFPDAVPSDVQLAAYDRLLERARRVPGVERAALSTTSPFWSLVAGDLTIPGFDSLRTLGVGFPIYNAVSADYFATAGIRVVRGRPITAADVEGAPRVALVNEAMARRIWKDADPIGRCMRIGDEKAPCSEIVGVVRTVINNELREPPQMQYYFPLAQKQATSSMRALVVRAAPGVRPASLAATLRRELAPAAPGARYLDVVPLEDRIDPQVRPWRLGATMFTAFGMLALLIAAVGLYSVMAYTVAQRLHEMGLRMALGARGRDVTALVLGQGMGVAAAGIALGAAAALAASHWVAPLLFDVSARDPLVYLAVAATLAAAALVASLVPARRATRVDPSDALRSE